MFGWFHYSIIYVAGCFWESCSGGSAYIALPGSLPNSQKPASVFYFRDFSPQSIPSSQFQCINVCVIRPHLTFLISTNSHLFCRIPN